MGVSKVDHMVGAKTLSSGVPSSMVNVTDTRGFFQAVLVSLL